MHAMLPALACYSIPQNKCYTRLVQHSSVALAYCAYADLEVFGFGGGFFFFLNLFGNMMNVCGNLRIALQLLNLLTYSKLSIY